MVSPAGGCVCGGGWGGKVKAARKGPLLRDAVKTASPPRCGGSRSLPGPGRRRTAWRSSPGAAGGVEPGRGGGGDYQPVPVPVRRAEVLNLPRSPSRPARRGRPAAPPLNPPGRRLLPPHSPGPGGGCSPPHNPGPGGGAPGSLVGNDRGAVFPEGQTPGARGKGPGTAPAPSPHSVRGTGGRCPLSPQGARLPPGATAALASRVARE